MVDEEIVAVTGVDRLDGEAGSRVRRLAGEWRQRGRGPFDCLVGRQRAADPVRPGTEHQHARTQPRGEIDPLGQARDQRRARAVVAEQRRDDGAVRRSVEQRLQTDDRDPAVGPPATDRFGRDRVNRTDGLEVATGGDVDPVDTVGDQRVADPVVVGRWPEEVRDP